MVFNTNNIRKNFKYKSGKFKAPTVSNTSSTTHSTTPSTASNLSSGQGDSVITNMSYERTHNANDNINLNLGNSTTTPDLDSQLNGTDTNSTTTDPVTPDIPTSTSTPGLNYNTWYNTPYNEKKHKSWKEYKTAHNLTSTSGSGSAGASGTGNSGGGDVGVFQSMANFFGGNNKYRDERYESGNTASAILTENAFWSNKGATSVEGGTYLNTDGTGINPATTPEEIAMDKKMEDAKKSDEYNFSDKQYPLYHGAPNKINIGKDGMVKHSGFDDLDTTNTTIDKVNEDKLKQYIPGVTKAKGISSNVSMGFSSPGTKAMSLKESFNFQSNTKTHTGMVKEWQVDFLKNPSRDQSGASNWLNTQLGQIDSMEGTNKNKSMFKKDLQNRYDGLFMNNNAPFQSPNTLRHNKQIENGMTKAEQKKEAKKLQAIQAMGTFNSSEIQGGFMPQVPTVVEPKVTPKVTPPATKKVETTNVINEYTNYLGNMYKV